MRIKLILAGAAIAVVASAYLAGYWSERGARIAAESHAETLRTELAAAQARVRTSRLLGRTLTLKESVMAQNYGHALDLSSTFFNEVGSEMTITQEGAIRNALAEILDRRDAVTAALAKGNATITTAISDIELRLRQALGYPVPERP